MLTTSATIGGQPLHIERCVSQAKGNALVVRTNASGDSPSARVTLCHTQGFTLAHIANKPTITSFDVIRSVYQANVNALIMRTNANDDSLSPCVTPMSHQGLNLGPERKQGNHHPL